jgi:hypothetical protein
MSSVAELDKKLNEMLLSGKRWRRFDEFYGEDVSMQENSDAPCVGKEANRKRELEFFGAIEKFYGMKLLSSAVQGDVSCSETESDFQMKGMPRFTMSQVSVRRWKERQDRLRAVLLLEGLGPRTTMPAAPKRRPARPTGAPT